MKARILTFTAMALAFSSGAARAQPPARPPIPAGQRLTAQDGDTIVVDGGARLRLVRHSEASVRILYRAMDRRVLVLFDSDSGKGLDGAVDGSLVFRGVSGAWPLGERWDGAGGIDEYLTLDAVAQAGGFGLRTGKGLIQLLSRAGAAFRDPSAVGVFEYAGMTRGPLQANGFDEAEQIALARETSAGITGNGPPQIFPSSGTGPSPVRVGGNIPPPTRLVDVKPVYPPEAQKSRVQGVVVIEAVIGPDGAVSQARVLRSVPALDEAALAAVRQWRYTPTMLNGAAVPVIMTVTVNFALQSR